MRKWLLISSFVLVPTVVLAAPSGVAAQQPKLDIKVFAGGSFTTYVEMLETGRVRDTYPGWQAGFGARIRKRKWFVETLLSFNRWQYSGAVDVGADTILRLTARVNSFQLPFNAGYIPYQNAYFRLFLYGGYVNHFNTKVLASVEVPGEPTVSEKFKPKEVDLAVYQALARFGLNIDLAMFNLDFNYSISMNSASTTSYRTGFHQLQLNISYLF
ncbi:MAG: hypothetical protein E4H00_04380 [Myxococcales bacterium]|nr:MAG: hypothetical protein E4H00_04380 [Myxococcales bacterium]